MFASQIATVSESINAATTVAAIKTIATDAGLPVPVATSAAKAREELLNHIATLDVTPDPQQETAEELELRLAAEKAAAEAKAEADRIAAIQARPAAERIANFKNNMKQEAASSVGSPYINKSILGGKTVDVIVLLDINDKPIRMQRVKDGPSDHAAIHFSINGSPKHTFLTAAEFSLIENTAKDCDLPKAEDLVDRYHAFVDPTTPITERAVSAVRLRMPLTAEGAVKMS